MSSAINNEILTHVKEIKGNVGTITNSLIVKFHEINKEYIDNMKLIISSSSSENIEKLTGTLERNTEMFIYKINQEIPKTHQDLNNKMKESFESFQENIVNDIKQQLNSSNNKEDTYKEIISSIDTKIQPINALITANANDSVFIKFKRIKYYFTNESK
jgi:hypothetical protein